MRDTRPDLSPIIPLLLVGEYPRRDDIEWLQSAHGVTAVVSLQDDDDLRLKHVVLADIERACADAGVHFERFPVPDYRPEGLAVSLPAILACISARIRDGHRVYLHCNAGLNRAPTVAIAYLRQAEGWSLVRARDHVKARRACGPYMQLLAAFFDEPI